MKLNLFEILLCVTFITTKISLGWYLGDDYENDEINQTVSNIINLYLHAFIIKVFL